MRQVILYGDKGENKTFPSLSEALRFFQEEDREFTRDSLLWALDKGYPVYHKGTEWYIDELEEPWKLK